MNTHIYLHSTHFDMACTYNSNITILSVLLDVLKLLTKMTPSLDV